MLNKLARIGNSRLYWLALVLIGFSMEAVALFYQYGLDEMPCVLCIQVRLWVMALIIVALLVLSLHRLRFMPLLGHLLTVVIAAGLLERSYQLLGTERGFVVGECGFLLGLPAWFTPDKWFPKLFEVQTSCGYTPELLFGVTMAEALIVMSCVFVLVSVAMSIAAISIGRSAD
ncbi:MAG: disulfide bond formation protein B [Gammaproteobacteria bacterium]